MTDQSDRIPYLLTGYSLPYTLGYIPLAEGAPNPEPWSLEKLAKKAIDLRLSGIEAPLTNRIPSFDGKTVELASNAGNLGALLRSENLSVVADSGIVIEDTFEQLEESLRSAHRAGATIFRVMISNLLCGDRRKIPGGWSSWLKETARRLLEVLPIAQDLGLVIAAENHQDATADDLLRLHDLVGNHPAFGIVLDTGNPLAVAEDPVETCQRIAHLIRHVHLKDYAMHAAPEGYRLVRCVAGQGVIDFPSILRIVRANGHAVTPGIEIAAQATRTIPLLDSTWWSTYPEQLEVNSLAPMKTLEEKGKPASLPYSSPSEQGANRQIVMRNEWDTLRDSVGYFRSLESALS